MHEVISNDDRELGDDDFVYKIDEDGKIDLHEAIRQNIIVDLPMRFICKENCPGITEMKDSKEKEIDPRLEKLKELKKDR